MVHAPDEIWMLSTGTTFSSHKLSVVGASLQSVGLTTQADPEHIGS
jgi:hypothetical protein